MGELLQPYIEELRKIDSTKDYTNFVDKLYQYLKIEGFDEEIIQNVRNKAAYIESRFSAMVSQQNMLKSKERLLFYLEKLQRVQKMEEPCQTNLEAYLQNFHLFLESLRELKPDQRATLTTADLQKIHIENEYNLQHLLYAVLKPLYKDIRKEVSEDSGIGMVRSDMRIPALNAVLETKCTRANMSLKKLTEEVEADIVHYNAELIYFYIYDRMKIIKNRAAFETYFNRSFDGKKVKCIILQPFYI